MSLNYYKTETEKVCRSKGWDRAGVDTVWLLLTEEFGELASAIRQYKKTYKKTNSPIILMGSRHQDGRVLQ